MNADRLLVQYVEDIIDACRKGRGFVDDVSFDSFSKNPEKQFAVIRALEIVGEAVKHIPESVRARYPEIPWREVAGMRDLTDLRSRKTAIIFIGNDSTFGTAKPSLID